MQATQILTVHGELTALWHRQEPSADGADLDALVRANHLHNFLLWHEEDIARRDDLGAERIREAKRAIDAYNQRRNNVIEQIDKQLVAELQPPTDGVPFNSETPGMMVDRLSILALKAYHMAEEAQRDDATPEHRAACTDKLEVIRSQRDDLAQALDELLAAVNAGARSFRVYFQFKMYNDPGLNPELRKAAGPAAS